MRYADVVILLVPSTYLLVALGLFPFDVNVFNALTYASCLAGVIIAHALFIDPPA